MLKRARGLWGAMARYFFDHIRLDPASAARIRQLPEEGTVVYVMRTRSTLDYLFFNYLYAKNGLPLARFANGIDLTFYRGLGLWFRQKWRRLMGNDTPQPPALEQLRTTVDGEHSAVLFMKVRALTAERRANPRFIDTLVSLQRNRDKPILLVPQHISWPENPHPSVKPGWTSRSGTAMHREAAKIHAFHPVIPNHFGSNG